MSKRSQIKVKGSDVLIYRHSDGYPGSIEKREIGVIPDIMQFCLAFIAKRGFDYELSIKQREDDLEWAKKEFYIGNFSFDWANTHVLGFDD